MPDAFAATLRDWRGFYQIRGEFAATLTGLLLVSVGLGARLFTATTLSLVRTFTSPALGCFLTARTLSALMCAQMRPWLTGELSAVGLIGLYRSVATCWNLMNSGLSSSSAKTNAGCG